MDATTKTIKYLAVLCRGGDSPGYAAVQALLQGQRAHVTAFNKGAIEIEPLSACMNSKNEATDAQLELIRAPAI